MTKSPQSQPAAKMNTPSTPNSEDFVWTTTPPPVQTRGRLIGQVSATSQAIQKLPAPTADGKMAFHFFPADEPAATITDATEREKAHKDNARKLSNNISGVTRRLVKSKPHEYNFAVRTITQGGKLGVGVWRINPTPAPVTQAATQASAAA